MLIKNRLKEKLKYLYYKYLGRPKLLKVIPKNVNIINCLAENTTLLMSTSNNVIKIKLENGVYYFRQCRLHTEIHEYVRTLIEEYYALHDLQDDKKIVEKSLSKKKNFAKFVNMGITNDKTSTVYKFCMGGVAELIGIENHDAERDERLRDLAQFIWGELYAYKLNSGVKIGSYQTYNAVRQIATKRLADMMGVSELIPNTEFAVLNISDGRRMFGTIMDAAPGIILERESAEKRKSIVTPMLQRSLNNLNFLDTLCREKDHRPGNYTVIINENKANTICAFDNDSPMSFGLGCASFKSYMNCSPYILHNSINRPYIDKNLVNWLSENNFKKIYQATKGLLNPLQMIFLKQRFKILKKAVSGLENQRVVSEEEWNEKTVCDELRGDYGETYLTLFTNDLKLLNQPWIKRVEDEGVHFGDF